MPTRFAPGGELGDADALPAFGPDDVAGFGAEVAGRADAEGCPFCGAPCWPPAGWGPFGCGPAPTPGFGLGEGLTPEPRRVCTLTPGAPSGPDGAGWPGAPPEAGFAGAADADGDDAPEAPPAEGPVPPAGGFVPPWGPPERSPGWPPDGAPGPETGPEPGWPPGAGFAPGDGFAPEADVPPAGLSSRRSSRRGEGRSTGAPLEPFGAEFPAPPAPAEGPVPLRTAVPLVGFAAPLTGAPLVPSGPDEAEPTAARRRPAVRRPSRRGPPRASRGRSGPCGRPAGPGPGGRDRAGRRAHPGHRGQAGGRRAGLRHGRTGRQAHRRPGALGEEAGVDELARVADEHDAERGAAGLGQRLERRGGVAGAGLALLDDQQRAVGGGADDLALDGLDRRGVDDHQVGEHRALLEQARDVRAREQREQVVALAAARGRPAARGRWRTPCRRGGCRRARRGSRRHRTSRRAPTSRRRRSRGRPGPAASSGPAARAGRRARRRPGSSRRASWWGR